MRIIEPSVIGDRAELATGAGEELSPFQRERRRLMQLMAAATSLAGAACSGPPAGTIVPYATAPEQLLPGEAVFYASALEHGGYGIGALLETNDGRPTKVEGNPLHPASLGATDPQMQASVLQLWDPARSANLAQGKSGTVATWLDLESAIEGQRLALERSRGEGLHVLMRPSSSPTLWAQLQALQNRYPRAAVHVYDPIHLDGQTAGTELAFGRRLERLYHFDRARIVLSLDADFLQGDPASLHHARDFSVLRNPEAATMSRIYAVESTPGLIGAVADHRLAISPPEIERLAYRLAAAFGIAPGLELPFPSSRWEAALLADLRAHSGASLVVAGERMPSAVHAIAHALNERLGTQGVTHEYREAVLNVPASVASLQALTSAAGAGAVRLLLILGVIRSMTRPRISTLRLHCAACRCRCTCRSTSTRPPVPATGTWRQRTRSSTGVTCAPSTAPPASYNRRSRRSMTVTRCMNC